MATHQILLRGAAQCCLLQAAMHLVDAVSSSLAALRLSGGQAGSRGQGSGRRQVTLSRLGVPRPAWGRRAVPEASAPPPPCPGRLGPSGAARAPGLRTRRPSPGDLRALRRPDVRGTWSLGCVLAAPGDGGAAKGRAGAHPRPGASRGLCLSRAEAAAERTARPRARQTHSSRNRA